MVIVFCLHIHILTEDTKPNTLENVIDIINNENNISSTPVRFNA